MPFRRSLKYAISAGIGLFLAIIGLKNAGLITAHPATLLTLGDILQPARRRCLPPSAASS